MLQASKNYHGLMSLREIHIQNKQGFELAFFDRNRKFEIHFS